MSEPIDVAFFADAPAEVIGHVIADMAAGGPVVLRVRLMTPYLAEVGA